MKTIKLLDLCCKAGGCSVGYFRAAKELGLNIQITGVDIELQPNYPFKFIKADAITYLKKHGHRYTHLHASPPCQAYSCSTAISRSNGKTYPDILEEIKVLFYESNKPCVIENVSNAPIRPDVILKGMLFGLKVIRKRKFELVNWFMLSHQLPLKNGSVKSGDYACVFGKGAYRKSKGDEFPKFKLNTVVDTWSYAMGIDWMKKDLELAEAIPPAYTHYIGMQFFKIK